MPQEKLIKVKLTRPADGKVVETEIPESYLPYLKTMNQVNEQINNQYKMFDRSTTGANFKELNPIQVNAGAASGQFRADYAFPDANLAATYQTDKYNPQQNPFLYNAGYQTKADQDAAFNALYKVNSYLAEKGQGELVSPDYRYGARHLVFADYEQPKVTMEPAPESKEYERTGTSLVRTQTTVSKGDKKVEWIPDGKGGYTKVVTNVDPNVKIEKNTPGADPSKGVDVGGYDVQGNPISIGVEYKDGKAVDKKSLAIGDQGIQQDVINTQRKSYMTGANPEGLVWDDATKQWKQWAPPVMELTPQYPFGGLINTGVTQLASALGANEKNAQLIGAGVATATGFLPGMQDNLFQATDLIKTATQNYNCGGPMKKAKGGPVIPQMPLIPAQPIDPNAHAVGPIEAGQYGTPINTNMSPAEMQRYLKTGEKRNDAYIIENGQFPVTGQPALAPAFDLYGKAKKNLENRKKFGESVEMPILPNQQQMGALQQYFAQGGNLTTFDNGGTHEENPLGGIPVGPNALVEEGETRWQDYIFSDRIKLPKSKQTFAQASKNIENKFKDRPNDPFSKKSKDQLMNALMKQQELLRAKAEEKLMKAYGGRIKYAGGSTLPTEDPFGTQVQGITPTNLSVDTSIPQNYQVFRTNQNTQLTPEDFGSFGQEVVTNTNRGMTGIPAVNTVQGTEQTPYNFDSKLTAGEYVAAFAPAAAGLIMAADGPATTRFDRAKASNIDLEAQRQAYRQQAGSAQGSLNQNIRNNATGSGQALSNMIAGNVGIMNAMNNQIGQSYMTEANANSQIQNAVNAQNTNIAMQEKIANEQNKARQQDLMLGALNSAANSYLGTAKDKRAFEANNLFNNQFLQASATQEFMYDPRTGTKYKNPNYKG